MVQTNKPLEFIAEVFHNGKITIPRTIREILDIKDGDYVRIAVIEIVNKKKEEEEVAVNE